MMHPKQLSVSDFTYELPEERIARYPLEERDLSKLLIFKDEKISEDIYQNLANHIPSNSLLVFNNTRVIPARLFFKNATAAKIEIFCLDPVTEADDTNQPAFTDMASAMAQTGKSRWNCLVGRAAKWKDKQVELHTNGLTLTAEIVARNADAFVVEFTWQPSLLTFAEVLDKTGMIPIPPYLKRETEILDQQRYQTMYALHKGSVAAPTAGLHFTARVMEALQAKGIQSAYLTLHVGAGTFKPVKADTMEGHDMHAEMIDVQLSTLQAMLQALNGNIIAVGTTSLRTMESLFWMGVKAQLNPLASIPQLEVKQWDPYDLPPVPVSKERTRAAMAQLIDLMQRTNQQRLVCKTQIMIAPGYQLRVADAIITNFHQPASTLLLLVAAVIGNHNQSWKTIYNYALQHQYRFLSYGDGCLLWAQK